MPAHPRCAKRDAHGRFTTTTSSSSSSRSVGARHRLQLTPFLQDPGREASELPSVADMWIASGWVACQAVCPTLLLRPHAQAGMHPAQCLREQRYGPALDYFGTRCARAGWCDQGREVFFNPPGAAPPNEEAGLEEALQLGRCLTLRLPALARQPHLAWVGGSGSGGYYTVRIGTRGKSAKLERLHRLVLWCVFGPPRRDWHDVPLALHMCGNPRCINPEHLVWGDLPANRRTIRSGDPGTTAKALATFAALLRGQGRLPPLPP